MAAVLAAAWPPAERGAVLTVAVVDPDDGAERVSLDVGDLELAGTLVDEFGMVHAAEAARADDDRTASLTPTATPPPGAYLATITVTSAELGLAGAVVAASVVVDANPFGAVLEDATALVVKTALTSSSNPSLGEARGYVADVANRVSVRLARRSELAELERTAIEAAARGVVALGAAAYISDAMHPERANSQGEKRYGEVLWQRHLTGLAELEEDLGARLTAGGVLSPGGRVAASFPPPGIGRRTGL